MQPVTLDARTRFLLFALPLLAFLLNLGGAPLFDVDEGAFSEATREMFERGDFLSTWLNGEPRFDKPILIYWLQAIFVFILGPNEWAFRLPSALAATFWAYAVGRFTAPRFGRDAAIMATAIVATCIGTHIIGRASTADSLLNMLLALALMDGWRHLEGGGRAPLLRSYLWIALGVLTKGPISLLVPGATTLLYCLSVGRWRDWLRSVFDPLGWLILIGVAAPWYVAALVIHGQDFIDGFFLRHNVQRFSGTLEGHSGTLFYYVLIVPALLLPWTSFLIAALTKLRSDVREPMRRFLWIWAGFVVVFFSLSGTKLPHYALYGCTPLFVLLGAHRNTLRNPFLAALPALLLLGVLAALPWLLQHSLEAGWVRDRFYNMQVARLGDALQPAYLPALICALVLSLGVALRHRAPAWRRVVLIAGAQTVLLCLLVTPFVGDVLQGPTKRAALAARNHPGPAVQWNFHAPSFSVYRQQQTPARPPQPGDLALTRADRLPADAPVDILFAEGGVRLVKVR
ncbi:ArnT family glycosyltransferase [Uliginosibacterium sp. H1]|uniref:ArnT family glycosyltransferase n=1 Tax=Uliginosibacterium sp. H1 TaxID=3114757 RepID=UPI002E18210C|nr:glycosyltransferase family 39 protein [Uliginosibacterium sp. H1]